MAYHKGDSKLFRSTCSSPSLLNDDSALHIGMAGAMIGIVTGLVKGVAVALSTR